MPLGFKARLCFAALATMTVSAAFAQKTYDPGAGDTEIKIGNIMPYSGPASSYGVIGKTEAAYFNKINAEGGINGRKITFDKIAVLWQNDDAGKDQFKGLKDGLGDHANMIIADKSYEVSDPSIDSQIVALRDSGADIFFSWAAPKGSAQAIRKVGELGWKPKFFLANTATSIASVLKPAGLEYAKGIISTVYFKDPTDPTWTDDPGVKKWREFMDKYYPEGDKTNSNNAYAYMQAQAMVQVLRQCGDNLTRENVMKQAADLKDFTSDMLLPGISVNTSPDDYFPIEQMQLMRFNGETWELFGPIITGEVGHDSSH
jgi:ABC-type branched-subunit amino acid transport system substrate-binding protein